MEQKNLFQLENEGNILRMYSDSYAITLLYVDYEADRLYVLETDKAFTITGAQMVHHEDGQPVVASELDIQRWSRPRLDEQRELVFYGAVQLSDHECQRFEIQAATMRYLDKIPVSPPHPFPAVPALQGYEIEEHAQRDNYLYLCGWSPKDHKQFFAHVCMQTSAVLRLYLLDCPGGEIVVNTLNLDPHEQCVYLAGKRYASDNPTTSAPYIERFSMYTPVSSAPARSA